MSVHSVQHLLVGVNDNEDQLKELGGQMSKCYEILPMRGLKFKADFHSKMSVCRHELGGSTPTILTLMKTKGIAIHCTMTLCSNAFSRR